MQDVGQIKLSLSFIAPHGVAFPRSQLSIISHIMDESNIDTAMPSDIARVKVHNGVFTEEAIRKAFTTFDLDGNGYISVAKLNHILILMGEQVSDKEVETMISMLDSSGDGQVNYLVSLN